MDVEKQESQRQEHTARFADDTTAADVPAVYGQTAQHDGSTIAPTLTQDTEKSSGYAASTAGLEHKRENAKAERKLLFKQGSSKFSLPSPSPLRFPLHPQVHAFSPRFAGSSQISSFFPWPFCSI
jgi:hypothetical protein